MEFGIQPRDKYNNKCEIEDIDGKLEKLYKMRRRDGFHFYAYAKLLKRKNGGEFR